MAESWPVGCMTLVGQPLKLPKPSSTLSSTICHLDDSASPEATLLRPALGERHWKWHSHNLEGAWLPKDSREQTCPIKPFPTISHCDMTEKYTFTVWSHWDAGVISYSTYLYLPWILQALVVLINLPGRTITKINLFVCFLIYPTSFCFKSTMQELLCQVPTHEALWQLWWGPGLSKPNRGLDSGSVTYRLCDLEHINELLCASVFSLVRWSNNNTDLVRLSWELNELISVHKILSSLSCIYLSKSQNHCQIWTKLQFSKLNIE